MPRLAQQPHQLERLVGRDPAADDQQDARAGHSRQPAWIAAMPPERLRTATRAQPGRAHHRRPASPGRGRCGCSRRDSGSCRASPATSRPEPRQHAERPGVVQRLQRGDLHAGEFEAEEPPAGPQHAPRLAQHGGLVGAVAQAEGDETRSTQRSGSGSASRVGDQRRRAGRPARARAPGRAPTASIARVDVGQDRRAAAARAPARS